MNQFSNSDLSPEDAALLADETRLESGDASSETRDDLSPEDAALLADETPLDLGEAQFEAQDDLSPEDAAMLADKSELGSVKGGGVDLSTLTQEQLRFISEALLAQLAKDEELMTKFMGVFMVAIREHLGRDIPERGGNTEQGPNMELHKRVKKIESRLNTNFSRISDYLKRIATRQADSETRINKLYAALSKLGKNKFGPQ